MAEFSKDILAMTGLNRSKTNELATAAATQIKEQITKNTLEDKIKRTATRKYNKSSSSSSKSNLPGSIPLNDRDQDEQEESSFDDDDQFQSEDEDDMDADLKGQFEEDGYDNDDNWSSLDY